MGDRNPTHGVLIVGHGTREPRGREAFFALCHALKQRWHPSPLAGGFLELAEPTIGQALNRLLTLGARRITVAPLMLFGAGHVRRDVPRAVAEAIDGRVDVEVRQADYLGCAPQILALLEKRFDEALRDQPAISPRETVLILAARGASHSEAVAEMHHLTELRRQDAAVGEVHTAFLAMARPRLPEVLVDVAQRRPRRVVVQPHLLFEGRLTEQVRTEVARVADQQARTDWVVTAPLGPDELLAQRLIEAVDCCDQKNCRRPADVSASPARNREEIENTANDWTIGGNKA